MAIAVDGEASYVAARRVLLDALDALGPQRRCVVLVGAQAIYLHAGTGDLAVAPMTTDADLALRVDEVTDEPEMYAAMVEAGFVPGPQPGTWRGYGDICVDLMVVPHQGGRRGSAARAAALPAHRKGVARIARGLEPALIDHQPRRVTSLDPADTRCHEIRVAGPGALLVAKLVKLQERLAAAATGARNRVQSKDALDIYRLLRAIETREMVLGLALHDTEEHAAAASAEAMTVLRSEGTRPISRLAALVSEALGGDAVAAASFSALANALVAAHDQERASRPSRRRVPS